MLKSNRMKVVLTGNNYHAISQRLVDIVSEFKKGGGSIERFDGEELTSADSLIDAVRSISLLDPTKLVIVKNFGQCADLMNRVEYLLEAVSDTTSLVMIDQKLDKRTAVYKQLAGLVQVEVLNELNPYDLERWVQLIASEAGVKIAPREAKRLIEWVGPNQQMLSMEVKKLALRGNEVSSEDIEELVDKNPQSKIFDMLDALFKGDMNNAWGLYQDQIAQGEDPHKVIAMITWQLQQIVLAVYAPDRSKKTLVDAGVSPYSAQKCLDLSARLDREQVRGFVARLAEIDLQAKTNADVTSALETYFSEVTLSITS